MAGGHLALYPEPTDLAALVAGVVEARRARDGRALALSSQGP